MSALYYLSTDDPAVDESVAQIIGVINLIIGAAAVVAGILVLQRKPAGRIMAFVVNGILLLSAILAIVQGEPLGLVNAIFASLIIAFLKDGSDFRPAR